MPRGLGPHKHKQKLRSQTNKQKKNQRRIDGEGEKNAGRYCVKVFLDILFVLIRRRSDGRIEI
jgi:hypothetical protein